jgi:hypothetical protein
LAVSLTCWKEIGSRHYFLKALNFFSKENLN